MSMFDLSLRDFLKQAASKAPTPGGGSAAALAAALGAAMGAMAANLTTGAKFEAVREPMLDTARWMEAAIGHCESILHEDIEAFDRYMAVLGMPKATEEERAARSRAMRECAKQAAEVPLKLMRRCGELLDSLRAAAPHINPNVASDFGIAVILLEAAVQSAWITVEINLPAMHDEEEAGTLRKAGGEILGAAAGAKDALLQAIRARMG